MIINFSVQNFGSIKEKQTLSFEANKSTHLEDYYIIEPIKGLRLNKLALIYGANASGKTTVLKALDFLRNISTDPFDKKTQTFDFEPFLFDENTPNQNTIFELEFVQNKIRYFYEVELNKRCIVKEKLLNYNPNKAVVFERTTNEEKELTSIKFGSKISKRKTLEENLEIFTLWNNTVIGGYLKTNVDSEELFDVYDCIANISPVAENNHNLKPLASSVIEKSLEIKNIIYKLLKKADFNFQNLILDKQITKSSEDKVSAFKQSRTDEEKILVDELSKKGKLDDVYINLEFEHFVNGKTYKLPIEKESLGTQIYLGFATLLGIILVEERILLIDELESSLHPDLFNHFLLTYLVNGKKESQLIATTHNREILNNKDLFRDDAIWFTDKNEESATQLYSLADFGSDVVRDTTNVLNAYKSGKLGGVPNLGDYYIDLEDEK